MQQDWKISEMFHSRAHLRYRQNQGTC